MSDQNKPDETNSDTPQQLDALALAETLSEIIEDAVMAEATPAEASPNEPLAETETETPSLPEPTSTTIADTSEANESESNVSEAHTLLPDITISEEATQPEPQQEETPATTPVEAEVDTAPEETAPTSVDEASSDETPSETAEPSAPPPAAEATEPQANPIEEKPEPAKPARRRYNRISVAQVTANFAACGRCGYFFADYSRIHGRKHIKDVAAESDGRWLILDWSNEMRRVIQGAFGHQLDSNATQFEGHCMICRRRYGFREDPAGTISFRVQIKKR